MTYWHWFSINCKHFPATELGKIFSEGLSSSVPSSQILFELGFPKASQWLSERPYWKELVDQKRAELERHQIKTITFEDSRYPPLLRFSYWPPALLFYQGDVNVFKGKTLGVVGARHPTEFGYSWARENVGILSENDFVIVSGGARGVDLTAHEAALKLKRPTILVSPGPLESPYPRSHNWLYQEIVDGGGLVISEYFPGYSVRSENFQRRNRLIVGLTLLVVIIEAARKSGTMLTANIAQREHKTMAVLPGPPGIPSFEGSLDLLFEGADFARDAKDIMSLYEGLKMPYGISD